MASAKIDIIAALVRQLVATQFPQWADLPIRPVEIDGWDNRTFHLGDHMAVRLPSAAGYAPQVDKEHRWLPKLAPHLPLPIPVPLAKGAPTDDYPWQWSIYQWIEGETATVASLPNHSALATSLAQFLTALQQIDPTDGPTAGAHSFFRGASLDVYNSETRNAITTLGNTINGNAATAVWETALRATWQSSPVWFHGDIAAGNLLVKHGQLSAVIDFGCSGVGDPACDTTIAWTFLSGESREVFRATLPVDSATWARGRGWALWKALITVVKYTFSNPSRAAEARRVIEDVLADHRANGA
jgi:aminoglycoside phosphotransferase (APT) family kinase protein